MRLLCLQEAIVGHLPGALQGPVLTLLAFQQLTHCTARTRALNARPLCTVLPFISKGSSGFQDHLFKAIILSTSSEHSKKETGSHHYAAGFPIENKIKDYETSSFFFFV